VQPVDWPGGHTVTGSLPVTLHASMSQHGMASEQAWPDCEHVVVALHVPCVEPAGKVQVPPGQQSALDVHGPDVGLQVAAQWRAPV